MAVYVVYDYFQRTAKGSLMNRFKIYLKKISNGSFTTNYEFSDEEISDIHLSTGTMIGAEELPVGELTFVLRTDEDIVPANYWVQFTYYGGSGVFYQVVSIKRRDAEFYDVTAQSALRMLDNIILPAKYYNNTAVTTVLGDLHTAVSQSVGINTVWVTRSIPVTVLPIWGYFPEQTARERLQWICFVARLRIITIGITYPLLIDGIPSQALATNTKVYQKPQIYQRPSVVANDAKKVSIEVYYFDPVSTSNIGTVDDWVEADNTYYLKNALFNTPVQTGDNNINITDIYIVNENNILHGFPAYVRPLYEGERYTATLSVKLNNIGDLVEGDHITFGVAHGFESTAGSMLYAGNIGSMDLTFGFSGVKADIIVPFAETVDAYFLTLFYQENNTILDQDRMAFHSGAQYSVALPQAFDKLSGNVVKVYCDHDNETASGTITLDTDLIFQYTEVLEFDVNVKSLLILDTDGATISSGVVSIE